MHMAGITIASRPPDVQHVAREAAGALRAGGPGTRVLTHRWALPRAGAWTWRGSALLAAVLLHPFLLVLALQHSAADRMSVAGSMSLLLVQISVLASAVVLMYDWRISRRATIGWLAMALSFIAAQHVPFALLSVQGAPEGRYGYVMGVTQLAQHAGGPRPGHARRAKHPVAGRQPLTNGPLLGGFFGAARFVLIDTGIDPTLRLTRVADLVVIVLVAIAAAGIIRAIVGIATLPGWARLRTVVFLVCMVTSRVLSTGRDNGVPSPLAVAVAVVGAVALGSAAATMLRGTINDNARRLVNLAHRAASAEVSVRHGQEKMHAERDRRRRRAGLAPARPGRRTDRRPAPEAREPARHRDGTARADADPPRPAARQGLLPRRRPAAARR